MNDRYFPPEWARQSAVLIAWPNPTGDFAPWYPEVVATYLHIAEAISQHQTLIIACIDEAHRERVLAQLSQSNVTIERVLAVPVGYDDIWVRDTAPLTIETFAGPRLLDFRFNAWGGKYPCAKDAVFAEDLSRLGLFGAAVREAIDFVLEGGSIETDGNGTLLTTRHCLLNPNRNPGHSEREIETILQKCLGIRRVLWLGHGEAEGDDTDAHIDTLARFCDPQTIAYTSCSDANDPQYPELHSMKAELQALRTAAGLPYRLIPLPIPQPIVDEQGTRLPATYANFLIINDAVLLPVYDDPNDAIARQHLAPCFPEREIVPINCRSLIRQFGSLHCMTMQFPASVTITAL